MEEGDMMMLEMMMKKMKMIGGKKLCYVNFEILLCHYSLSKMTVKCK